MPYVEIPASPLAPDLRPVALHYRAYGPADGPVLLWLHGGWGFAFYPIDAIVEALPAYRILAPDRTGYGGSPRLRDLPARFHEAAAAEHAAFLDALGVARCAIWGHSDGAIIAALMALREPARVTGLVLEALHLDRAKPRSREFFTAMRDDPESFGARSVEKLVADHGEPGWRDVLGAGGRAWLAIAATPDEDFYAVGDRRLADLAAPTLVIHGVDDPRTEPDELARIAREVPHARLHWVDGGGHSPHSKTAVKSEVAAVAARFLRAL